jgi:hypothetical protein
VCVVHVSTNIVKKFEAHNKLTEFSLQHQTHFFLCEVHIVQQFHKQFDSKKVKDLLPMKMGRSLQTRGLSKIFVK